MTTPNYEILDWDMEKLKQFPFFVEIMNQGRVEATQKNILVILEVRFGRRKASSFAEAIRGIEDLTRLTNLHGLAALCSDLEEFRSALGLKASRSRRRPPQTQ